VNEHIIKFYWIGTRYHWEYIDKIEIDGYDLNPTLNEHWRVESMIYEPGVTNYIHFWCKKIRDYEYGEQCVNTQDFALIEGRLEV